jgi:hypothetical protein
MADNNTTMQEWPDQRLKILVPAWSLMIISSMFLVWRVVYGLRKSRRFMLSDYLLIIATVSDPTIPSIGIVLRLTWQDAQHCWDM